LDHRPLSSTRSEYPSNGASMELLIFFVRGLAPPFSRCGVSHLVLVRILSLLKVRWRPLRWGMEVDTLRGGLSFGSPAGVAIQQVASSSSATSFFLICIERHNRASRLFLTTGVRRRVPAPFPPLLTFPDLIFSDFFSVGMAPFPLEPLRRLLHRAPREARVLVIHLPARPCLVLDCPLNKALFFFGAPIRPLSSKN